MLKAIIFDMGGTLLHFAPPGSTSWRELETPGIRHLYQYLVDQGQPIAAHEDAFVETMFARLAEGWAQATHGQHSLNASAWIAAGAAEHALVLDQDVLRQAARVFAKPLQASVRAAPGAVSVLTALQTRGLKLGLISNTIWPAELHLEDLQALGLLRYFAHTLFSGDFGVWKPQPAIFQHMLEALGVSASEAMFVGDSPLEDIRGAQGVGIRAVWLRNGEFPLGDVEPDIIIHELSELSAIASHFSS